MRHYSMDSVKIKLTLLIDVYGALFECTPFSLELVPKFGILFLI